MKETDAYRILIVDDHPIAVSGLDFLLTHQDGVEITGHARDGNEALQLCADLQPDLLILDLMLPKLNGLMILEALSQMEKRPRVLIISGQASGINFKQARDLGAEGLVSKEDEPEYVLSAISQIRSGAKYLSPVIKDLLRPFDSDLPGENHHEHLTSREREVLALVAEGLSNELIGDKLHISPKTAKKHRENLMRKLGISTAVQATRVAARLGLFKLE